MTVQLTTVVGLDAGRQAGQRPSYQVAGSISRPIWGWLADRLAVAGHTRWRCMAWNGGRTAVTPYMTG